MASAPRPVAAAAMVPESTASSPAPDLVPVTHVSMCRCEGDGLANAIVRTPNNFRILAFWRPTDAEDKEFLSELAQLRLDRMQTPKKPSLLEA